MGTENQELITVAEYAKARGVTTAAVYKRLDKGLKPWVKVINGKKYMVGFTPEYIKIAVKAPGLAGNEIVNVRVSHALNGETMEGEIFKDS